MKWNFWTFIYPIVAISVLPNLLNGKTVKPSLDEIKEYFDINSIEDEISNSINRLDFLGRSNSLGPEEDNDDVLRKTRRRRHVDHSVKKPTKYIDVCSSDPGKTISADLIGNVWTSEDFCELVLYGNGTFVDKSMLIWEVLNGGETVPMMKRPSGWGKTVNLSMMKRFLEFAIDAKGDPLPVTNDTLNYKLFAGGEVRLESADDGDNRTDDGLTIRLKPLKVTEHLNVIRHLGHNVMQHFGISPVMSLTYKNIVGRTYAEIEDKTRALMAELYRRYRHLESWITDDEDKARFGRFVNGTATYEDLEKSILFLTRLLRKRYDQAVYVLVDDHDTPVYQFYLHLNETMTPTENITGVQDTQEYEDFLNLFGNIMINGLRKTHYLARGFTTGFAASKLFDFTVLDEELSKYFGFLPEEVDKLLANLTFPVNRVDMKNWYYGYGWGVYEQQFYIPYSTVRYLATRGRRLDYYTLNSRDTSTLDRYVMQDWFQPTMQYILAGNKFYQVIEGIHGFPNIHVGKRFVNLLLFYGFLNPIWFKYYKAEFHLCNEEMKRYYETRIERWLDEKLATTTVGFDYLDVLLATTSNSSSPPHSSTPANNNPRTPKVDNNNNNNNSNHREIDDDDIQLFRSKLNETVRLYFPDFPKEGNETVRLYNVILKSILKSSPNSSAYCNCQYLEDLSPMQSDDRMRIGKTLIVEPKDERYQTAAILMVKVAYNDLEILPQLNEGSKLLRGVKYQRGPNNRRSIKRLVRMCLVFKYLDVHLSYEVENLPH